MLSPEVQVHRQKSATWDTGARAEAKPIHWSPGVKSRLFGKDPDAEKD